MKHPARPGLLVMVLFMVLPAACVRSLSTTATAFPLANGSQQVTFGFEQNGAPLTASGGGNEWRLTLEPEPFTLAVDGDAKAVSIAAVRTADPGSPLLSLRTLIAIPGTGNAFSANDLYVTELPLETYPANRYALQHLDYFAFPQERAASAAEALESRFGTEPLLLFSGRSYLYRASDKNYTVETIGGKTIQSGDSIVLLAFVQDPESEPFDFYVLRWLRFDLEFKQCSADASACRKE